MVKIIHSENRQVSLLPLFLKFSYGSVVAMLLSFLSTPIITRLFQPEEYGKVSLFNTYFMILNTFLFLGLDQSYIRFYYRCKDKAKLIHDTVLIPIILSIFVSLLCYLYRLELSIYLFGEYNTIVVVLIIIKILCLVPNRYALQSIRMEQKANIYSFLNLFEKILYILIIIAGILFATKYSTLIFAYVFSLLITTIIASLFSIEIFKKSNSSSDDKNFNNKSDYSKKEIYFYAFPLVPHFILFWFVQSFDKIIIRQYCSYTDLGIYSSAYTFVTMLSIIQIAFSSFWTPISLQLFEKGSKAKNEFTSMTNIVTICMLIIGVVICSSSGIIVFLLGAEYRSAGSIIHLLCLIPVYYTISESTVNGIVFSFKTYLHTLISCLSAIVCIALNLILVPRYGIVGAAIGTATSFFVMLILRTLISQKLYPLEYNLINILVLPGFLLFIGIMISFFGYNFVTILLLILFILILTVRFRKDYSKLFSTIRRELRK